MDSVAAVRAVVVVGVAVIGVRRGGQWKRGESLMKEKGWRRKRLGEGGWCGRRERRQGRGIWCGGCRKVYACVKF